MSVKPSEITGTGTESSPYVIHNYDELKWCCEDADAIPEGQALTDYVFVKVNNDIDCSTYGKAFRWSISCAHAVDLDLNNKTIENFYIKYNSYMFIVFQTAKRISIHDGKLLNIYGDWIGTSVSVFYMYGNGELAAIDLRNVSMSIDVTNFGTNILCAGNFYYVKCTNCTIDFAGTCSSTGGSNTLMAGSKLTTCDIHINVTAVYLYIIDGTSSNMGYALNCRFMGQLSINQRTATAYATRYTTLRNCVIDLDIISRAASTHSPTFAYSPGAASLNYGIYNVDKLPNYQFNNTQYIACTTSDMDMRVNPNADTTLQEKGFDVIKG